MRSVLQAFPVPDDALTGPTTVITETLTVFSLDILKL